MSGFAVAVFFTTLGGSRSHESPSPKFQSSPSWLWVIVRALAFILQGFFFLLYLLLQYQPIDDGMEENEDEPQPKPFLVVEEDEEIVESEVKLNGETVVELDNDPSQKATFRSFFVRPPSATTRIGNYNGNQCRKEDDCHSFSPRQSDENPGVT